MVFLLEQLEMRSFEFYEMKIFFFAIAFFCWVHLALGNWVSGKGLH